ncbi:amino acid ABC transporter permease [Aureimonas altamirensis]|uniref:amino acid ABC transporter permease n=1 Tax=Aureimonas altamirensis TaxID=370622 RepID=UPI001E41A672|nr:amino acid ABC transporter permease [Aureimonas altamirensis]UHD46427.1 amino acid ABC transporter permease [Aureimonas altamirensis]
MAARQAAGNGPSIMSDRLSNYRIIQRPRYGRWISAAAILTILAAIAYAFATGQIDWATFRRFLTAPAILNGVVNTVILAVLAMGIGIVLGTLTAIMRSSDNPVLQSVAFAYIWLFRGTPVLLQLMLWYNLALIFPTLGIPGLWSMPMIEFMTPFTAALLGLGLNQGAYTAEVMRAGMLSVDTGQYEAAKTIGMTRLRALRRIILPQAMRVVIPPLGNEFILLVKTTSLASVIQFSEVMYNASSIYYANARVVELLLVAGAWYLVVVSILTLIQIPLERHFSRGSEKR